MIEENRLEKIEDMVATLISMVGNMNKRLDSSIAVQEKFGKEQSLMREELNRLDEKVTKLDGKVADLDEKVTKLDGKVADLDRKVTNLDGKLTALEEKVDLKFENIDEKTAKLQEGQNSMRSEMMEKLITIQADQDLIWEKSVRNEREIAKIKATLQS